MIQANCLRKAYGGFQAVDGVSFAIEAGEAFGLLGPNGAGKTTVIHMLAGILEPDDGDVMVAGLGAPSERAVRRKVGVAPQSLALYEELTGEENLNLFGRLYGLSGEELRDRVAWCLEFAGLTDRRKQRVQKYSGGMQRRLNLACALVHEPDVLICDEPTVGVDPQSRGRLFDCIEELCHGGTTLIYTTHYMEEAQRLCDRVAIMEAGKILALDSVDALIDAHGGGSIVNAEFAEPPAAGLDIPGELNGAKLRVDTSKPFDVVSAIGRTGLDVTALHIERPDLERVFFQLTGRSLRD